MGSRMGESHEGRLIHTAKEIDMPFFTIFPKLTTTTITTVTTPPPYIHLKVCHHFSNSVTSNCHPNQKKKKNIPNNLIWKGRFCHRNGVEKQPGDCGLCGNPEGNKVELCERHTGSLYRSQLWDGSTVSITSEKERENYSIHRHLHQHSDAVKSIALKRTKWFQHEQNTSHNFLYVFFPFITTKNRIYSCKMP